MPTIGYTVSTKRVSPQKMRCSVHIYTHTHTYTHIHRHRHTHTHTNRRMGFRVKEGVRGPSLHCVHFENHTTTTTNTSSQAPPPLFEDANPTFLMNLPSFAS